MRKTIKTILKIVLSLLILAAVGYRLNVHLDDILHAVRDWRWLAVAAVIPTVVTTAISVNRWKTFLAMIGVEENAWRLAQINLTSSFLGFVLPGSQGFDLLRIYAIERAHPEKRGLVGSTVLVERIFGLICLLMIAVVSWLVMGGEDSILAILLLTLLVLVTIIVIRNPSCYRFLMHLLDRIPVGKRLWTYLSQVYSGLHTFPFDRRVVASVLLILLLQLTNISVVAILFEACDCHLPFLYHLCYQPLISVLTLIPVTFGGVGIREGAFALFYTHLGVDGGILISVSLLYYLVIGIIPAMVGGVIYMVQTIRKSR